MSPCVDVNNCRQHYLQHIYLEPLVMPLAPPIETEYPSYANEKKDILKHAREEGYGVAEKRSKNDKKTGEIRKVWIHCDKSGKRRAVGAIRKTSTRKTDCPFELTVTRTPLQDWKVTVIHRAHNHEASRRALNDVSPPFHNNRAYGVVSISTDQ
jgi:FAR1 DNA-binding domain